MEELAINLSDNQLCGFRIKDGYYAISVLDVQEVIKPQRVTTVPLAPDYIRGLINLRGQIVTSISLKKLFGMEDVVTGDHMNIIVRSADSLYALLDLSGSGCLLILIYSGLPKAAIPRPIFV